MPCRSLLIASLSPSPAGDGVGCDGSPVTALPESASASLLPACLRRNA